MGYLGIHSIDDYIFIPVISHDTSGSAAALDSGSFSIDFYEKNPAASGNMAAMTTPDGTFNTVIDTKTGLYGFDVQLTGGNGFEAGKHYYALVHSGTVDSQTPATLWNWQVNANGEDLSAVFARIISALPNAAADAAGGLPISDAGGLDLDTKLANTNEVTAARMGALTDWINGGRLDLIIDQVLADTNELQTDWTDGGRLDVLLDAIPVLGDGIGAGGDTLSSVLKNINAFAKGNIYDQGSGVFRYYDDDDTGTEDGTLLYTNTIGANRINS